MDSPLPPDPYAALGLAKNATATQIKTAYRKLALQCHPDKVTDASLKKQKADEFHRVQQAYDIIGDDEQRSKHDALVRLAELRAEALRRHGGGLPRDVRMGAFDFRTSTTSEPALDARGSSRTYSSWKSPSPNDDHPIYGDPWASARAFDEYDAPTRRPAPHGFRASDDAKERDRLHTKEKEREERRRTRERGTRRDREGKYNAYFENDSDDGEDDRYRYSPSSGRHGDERRSDPILESRRHNASLDYFDDTDQKIYSARDYIQRSKNGPAEVEVRPQPTRSASARDAEFRRGDSRPAAFVRKTSSRPSSSGKVDRKDSRPELVDFPSPGAGRDRRHGPPPPPPLVTSHSSPSSIKIPPSNRDSPKRAYTEYIPPPPQHPSPLRRAETTPIPTQSSSANRRKDSIPMNSSKLRHAETHDSGYSSPGTPEAPKYFDNSQSAKSTKYYYSNANDDYSSNYQPEAFRDDSDRRPRQRTPSPSTEHRYASDRDATPRASRGARDSTTRYPPPSRSSSYAYTSSPVSVEPSSNTFSTSSSRPKLYRTESSRGGGSSPNILRTGSSGGERLFGDAAGTPRGEYPSPRAGYASAQYAKTGRGEDVKYEEYQQGGGRGGRRGSEEYGYGAYKERERERESYRPRMDRSATYAYG